MPTLSPPRPRPQARPARPRKPEPRSIAVVEGLRGGNAGIVRITVGKKVDHYAAVRLDVPVGSARELRKYVEGGTPEGYHVHLCGEESSCDCAGFTFGRADPPHCKHLDGLRKLAERGLL